MCCLVNRYGHTYTLGSTEVNDFNVEPHPSSSAAEDFRKPMYE